MALFGRKKPSKPQSEEEMLQEAFAGVAAGLDKRDKQRKKRQRKFMLPAWLDSRVLLGLAIIVIVIIADAVRRENQEFTAALTGFSGQVTVQASEDAAEQWATVNQQPRRPQRCQHESKLVRHH